MAQYLVKRGTVWHIEVNNATYGRIRETTGCTDEAKAQLVLQKRLGEAAEAVLSGSIPSGGTKVPTKGMTLREGYHKTLREHWQRDTGTSSTVEHNWKAIVAHMDVDMQLTEVSRSVLVKLVGDLLAAGMAKGTVNRKLSVLSTILNKAVDEWEIMDSLPKFPTLKEPTNQRLPMSPADKVKAQAYLAEGHGKWDADVSDFIELSWGCGARLSEVANLEDHHIDLEAGTISLWKTKNKTARVLPITPAIKTLLINRSGSGMPFRGLNKDNVDHVWARCREACGISKQVCIHSIRHTVISRLVDADVSILKIMQFVGHKRIETTKRYTHLSATALTDCAKALS